MQTNSNNNSSSPAKPKVDKAVIDKAHAEKLKAIDKKQTVRK